MTSRKSKKASNMGLANNKERGKSPKLSAYQQAQGSVASTVAVSHGTISSGLHLTSEGSASPEVASSSEESIFPPSTTSSDTRSSRNATLVAELEAALEQGDSSEETASPRRNNPSDGSSVDSGQSKYPQGFEIRSSNTPESLSDLENTLMPSAEKYDSSADDLIITESAQALIRPESGMMIENLSCQSHPDGNKDMLHGSDESEHSDYECSGCLENSGPRGCFQSNETMDITPEVNQRSSNDTLIRTLLQLQVPSWFPQNIKGIFQVDHHGGALSFKELNAITRYRGSLEMTRRRKWKKYITAGEARFKLRRIMQKLRSRTTTSKEFYEFRKKQYRSWKEQALRRWKQLEKTQGGIKVLDDTINANFAMERTIYRKKLD